MINENEDQDRIENHARIHAMVDYLSEDRAVTDEGRGRYGQNGLLCRPETSHLEPTSDSSCRSQGHDAHRFQDMYCQRL